MQIWQCLNPLPLLDSLRGINSSEYSLEEAQRSLKRIERTLEKIDVLLVGYEMPNEERYVKFLKICEQDIEEDLATVEAILSDSLLKRRRSKQYKEHYADVSEVYQNIRYRLRYYVD